ncbi:putative plastid-lipid-associated protein 4 [Quercus suber]|uniref:Plastid-lipid-associated protein 4 n=1 Tax=Quercus suber TaxID=58331 RepID=A0AAW0LMP1_QUESU
MCFCHSATQPSTLQKLPSFSHCTHYFSCKIPTLLSKTQHHNNQHPHHIKPNKLSDLADSWKWRTQVSFFTGFLTKGRNAESLKEELYAAIAPLDRGAEATPEDQQLVEQIARKLEAVNEVKEPLKSNLLNGKWNFYIQHPNLFCKRRPNGKIYQAINVDTLRAQNMETWPFFNQVLLLSNI